MDDIPSAEELARAMRFAVNAYPNEPDAPAPGWRLLDHQRLGMDAEAMEALPRLERARAARERDASLDAQCYISDDARSLVIAFSGTQQPLDFIVDVIYKLTGVLLQERPAIAFAKKARAHALELSGGADVAVTLTGHSLGGLLAQIAAIRGERVYAFNPLYVRDQNTAEKVKRERTLVVYSNPLSWTNEVLTNAIHSGPTRDAPQPNPILYVANAERHTYAPLLAALEAGPTLETVAQYADAVAADIRSGAVSRLEAERLLINAAPQLRAALSERLGAGVIEGAWMFWTMLRAFLHRLRWALASFFGRTAA